MEVTQDEYELPLAVSESPTELARMAGTTKDHVKTTAYRRETGQYRRGRFVRVEVEDD